MSECGVTASAPPAIAAARVEELCVTRQSSAAQSRINAIAKAAAVVMRQRCLVGGVELASHAAGQPGKDSRAGCTPFLPVLANKAPSIFTISQENDN